MYAYVCRSCAVRVPFVCRSFVRIFAADEKPGKKTTPPSEARGQFNMRGKKKKENGY